MEYKDKLKTVTKAVLSEINRAKLLHKGDFNNLHEAYAVLFEEVDELWDLVKTNPLKHYSSMAAYKADVQKEAIQVCAMAIRLIVECTVANFDDMEMFPNSVHSKIVSSFNKAL